MNLLQLLAYADLIRLGGYEVIDFGFDPDTGLICVDLSDERVVHIKNVEILGEIPCVVEIKEFPGHAHTVTLDLFSMRLLRLEDVT